MNDISVGIRVDSSQVVNARRELAGLAGDRKKYGIDLEIPVEFSKSVNKERGGNIGSSTEKAARSATLYRREMEGARKSVSDMARDYDKLIKTAATFRATAGGAGTSHGDAIRAAEGYASSSEKEMQRSRSNSQREAKAFTDSLVQQKRQTWAERNGVSQGNATPGRPDDMGGGAGGRNSGAFMKRVLGWGAAAVGIGSIAGFIGASRSAYRSAIDEESPLFARGLKGVRGRAGMAAGMGIGAGEYYGLEDQLSRNTGLNEKSMPRAAMLSASFARFGGLETSEVAGLRGSIYQATGSNTRIPDAVLLIMGESVKKGMDKARLPELLTMIGRNTGATASAMHGAGVSSSQIGSIVALSTAALGLKDGTSYKQFAKSGEFSGLMQNGLQGAGTPAGEIQLFSAMGGFKGPMSFEKIHEMNLMKQGGFLKRPDLLRGIIGNMSGSKGARAGQLETMFKSWGIDGAAADNLIQMNDSGFLKRMSGGKSIEAMAKGGDKEAARWLQEIKDNPALGRQATEATKDLVKIEAGEKLSKLFEPMEMAAAKFTGALVDGKWQSAFDIFSKAAGAMGPVSKTLLAAGGLMAAGGTMSFIGSASGLLGKAGGGALLSSLMGPLGLATLGGVGAYATFKDGGNFQSADRMRAITGKGPSNKFSSQWVPYKSDFDKAAKDFNIDPALLYAMGRTESGFRANAISKKGATGVMQLMPGTAKGLGVDPTIPGENIRGGAAYLASLLKKYDGDEGKALAAYNWGSGNVDKGGKLPTTVERYVQDVKTARQGYFESSQPGATGGDAMQALTQIMQIIADNTGITAGRHTMAAPLAVK